MRDKSQIQNQLNQLEIEYSRLCANYGNTLLKLRYWSEQKEGLEKQIDQIGEMQKDLNMEMQYAPEEGVDEPQAEDRSSNQPASA